MTLKDKLTYRLLHVISRRMRQLSNIARSRFANQLGAFAFNCIPIRKKLAYNNIKTAFPNNSETWINNVLIGTYRLFFTNFLEFLSLPKLYNSIDFHVKNKHILDKAAEQKKGVIIVTGHFGLWEILGSWLGVNGYPIWGIIQRQGNQGADLFFKEMRESYGMNHIYRKSSLDNICLLYTSDAADD